MPINTSKYCPPSLPTVVSRLRLNKHLQDDSGRHLVLVTGQAAQGKTTLVANFLATSNVPDAWLHLDNKDGDSANFYHNVIHALTHILPASPLTEYAEQTHITMGTSEAIVRYEALLGSIWGRLPNNIHLVLDGLEQLPEQAPTWHLIQRIVDLAADKGRLFLLSRQIPPIKLQKQVIQRTLLTLDNETLAFTPEEVSAYFKRVHDFRPAKECIAGIWKATSGWAGGLVLVSQLLSRLPRSQWDSFLTQQLPDSLADDAWRYFAEEIFSALPNSTKHLLSRAALLDIIDPSILNGLVKGRQAKSILDDLVQRNLFIQIVHDMNPRPLYRFNHLFQRFLKDRFRSRSDPAEQRKVLEQIGRMYEDRRQAEIAVDYYIAAKQIDATARCIKKVGIDLVIRGRFTDLAKAIAALPPNLTRSDPWLFLLLTLTRRITGGSRNIRDFQTVRAAFEKRGDTRGQLMALAYLIEAQVFAGHDPAGCRAAILQAEALLDSQSNTPFYSYARTLLWLQIGFAYIASGLDLVKGVSACQNACILARKIDNLRLMTHANIVIVLGLTLRGDFDRADGVLEKIAVDADAGAYAEYHTLRGLVNAELAMHRGDLISAKKRLKPLAGEIETFGLLFLYPAYLDTMGFMQIYGGQFAAARDPARHLLDISTLSNNPCYEGMAHRLNAMRHYFQGNYDNARDTAKNALAFLPRDALPTLRWMRTRQLAGLIYLHLKNYARAAEYLNNARQYFEETSNFLSLSETLLALGLLAHLRSRRQAATRHWHHGFSLAADHRYDHYVILCPDDLKTCCQLAGQYLDGSALAWSQRLLETVSSLPLPAAAGTTGKQEDASTKKPFKGARVRDKQHYLEIFTLGKFQVVRNGHMPLEKRHWGGNRTRLLLKSIVVHGLKEIPKDIIIEDLWPESSPESALQNFKVTLHRLRKCLEPDLKRHGRSAFIHLSGNLISLDTDRCYVDVQEFLQYCKDIRRAALTKETQTIVELGRRVMDLYRGDFLPEDPYASWTEMKRLAIKDEYLTVLMVMADIYRDQGQIEAAIQCCRLAIAADICLENATGKLMQIYVDQERRNDAISLYQRFQSALRNDLGVDPDPAITALYHRIRRESQVNSPSVD